MSTQNYKITNKKRIPSWTNIKFNPVDYQTTWNSKYITLLNSSDQTGFNTLNAVDGKFNKRAHKLFQSHRISNKTSSVFKNEAESK